MNLLLALVALAQVPVPANSTMGVCQDNVRGGYDTAATASWQQEQRLAQPDAMKAVAGKWYQEIPSPQTGQVAYVTVTYSPLGVVDFFTRTCGTMMGYTSCSDDVGHGQYAARKQADGSYLVMRNLSSSTRTNACGAVAVRVEGNTMIAADGSRATRIP